MPKTNWISHSHRRGFVMALFAAVLVVAALLPWLPVQQLFAATEQGAELEGQVAALKTEIERLQQRLPGQAHAMMDVAYHFNNLWFAGKEANWPLADFYLKETRSHLAWAIRIIPVRKTAAGDLDLTGILEGVDAGLLEPVKLAIESKDAHRFEETYRQSINGCNACHQSAEKPYLRVIMPTRAPESMIAFEPILGGQTP